MCGIVGAFAFGSPNDIDPAQEKIRQEAMIFMTTELLQQTQTRGEDATGIATLFDNGMYMGLKSGINAINFISSRGAKETDYQGYIKIWRNKINAKKQRYARIHIGHCRKSSVGNSLNNDNNHPIVVDPLIGIHNGTLKNHEIIFKKLECDRTGDVDSEAILRLTHFYTNGGKLPFTADMMKEVGQRLDGTFATIIMNANNPYQVTLMKDMRPVELLLIRPLKLVLVASESKFFDIMLFRYNKYLTLYNLSDKLPLLRKVDIQEKCLANDDIVVFDLTKDITDDTKMTDLCDEARLTYNQKKWKATYSTTTYTNGSYYNRNRQTGNTTAKTTTTTGNKTTTVVGGGTGTAVGKVWNKSMQGFKDAKKVGTGEHKDKGNVTVDVTTGDIKKVTNAGSSVSTTTTKIDVDSVGDVNKKTEKKADDSTSIKDTDVTVVSEVDMSVNPAALEEAEKHAKLSKRYETEEEIADDLDLLDVKVLKNLPLVALTNRIKKFIYKIGFYDGCCFKEEEMEKGSRPDLKERKREQNIRVLKSMTKTLSTLVDGLCPETTIEHYLNGLNKSEELSPDKVKKVLKKGDIRDSTALRKIVEWVEKEHKSTTAEKK